VLQRCISAGWVDFTPGEYTLLVLTPSGRAVLEGKRPGSLLLPRRELETGPRPRSRSRSRRGDGRGSVASTARGRSGEPDEALFEALREWRRTESLAGGVPAFVVATDRALREIATLRPTTTDELLTCHGIGPQKAERYGAAILAIVRRV
jgi:ATP-dependent DNA helicase RecQ